jgi:rhodanese-related sulfurtransferase
MLRAGFGSKLAWIAEHEREIVFVGRDDQDGRDAAQLAVAIGLRRLAGFLGGGMTSWRQEARPTSRIERVAIQDLPGRLEQDGSIQVLDVRDRSEWDQGHIPDSAFETWHDITGVPDGLDPEQPIAVVCASGQRAATAASLVAAHGASQVLHVVGGGVPAWGRMGEPVQASG